MKSGITGFIIHLSEINITSCEIHKTMCANRAARCVRSLRPPYLAVVRPYTTTLSCRRKQDLQSSYSPPRTVNDKTKRNGFLGIIFTIIAAWEITYMFGYEPLRDRGFFDAVAQSTVFSVIGPKKVKPKRNAVRQPERPLYQPITGKKEIRLLTLEPGQHNDEIKCSLVNVKLSWRTRYEALSYTWGDPTVTVPIKLSGHDIEVTSNLHSALMDLRYTDKPRNLWVDAVCINQADLQEKSQQIMLMGSIYSHARRVLIYLGPMTTDVSQAIQNIRILDSKMKALHFERYNSRLNSFGSWGRVLFGYLPSQKPLPAEFDWQPIVRLLQRPWFERTWIIQEAILAHRGLVICGDKSVPWLKFERVAHDIYMYHHTVESIPQYHTIHDAIEGLDMMRLARRDQERLHSMSVLAKLNPAALHEYSKLLDLLFDTRAFLCSNPRDKIYGLLGVTSENIHNNYITPDYNLSIEEVFRRFVVWEILNNRSLRVLGLNSDKSSKMNSLPSWTPDFTNLSERKPLLRRQKRVSFSAGENTAVEAHVSEDGQILYVKGQIMDRVHTVAAYPQSLSRKIYIPSSPPRREIGEQKKLPWYRDLQVKEKWLTEVLSIASAAFDRLEVNRTPLLDFYTTTTKTPSDIQILGTSRRPKWELLWRTLTCNHTEFVDPVPNYYREWVVAYTDLVRSGLRADEKFVQTWLPRAQHIESGIAYFSQGRRFTGTDGGLIGWVPEETIKGDEIVILYGSRVPIVVRGNGEGKYRLIGECYIHGLMDGQAINAQGKQDRETVVSLV
ncbi:heterokaryon incompatibility protein-domain-containing protein [Xylaria arbuscula]|nr:heterokaryon incompatibility protein-domain-containing protein [Xylaria arbuscula]